MHRSRFLFYGIALCAWAAAERIYAMPPWIPVSQRAAASQIVLVADVVSSSSRNLNQTIDSAVVVLNTVRVLKKPDDVILPENLSLQFVVYPHSFESRMRSPPEPGRYFVFLNIVKTEKTEGGDMILFRLYEPNPFAFDLWSAEKEEELRRLLNRG
jgi:hypothetical protein